MLARVLTASTLGIDAFQVEVEVDISRGLPSFSTVGLPDNAVKESKDRGRSAIKNSGYNLPAKKINHNPPPCRNKKRRHHIRPAGRDRHFEGRRHSHGREPRRVPHTRRAFS